MAVHQLSSIPGRNLLINVVDHHAEVSPNKLFASLPTTNDPRDGFQDITYGQLRSAVDRTAHFLDNTFGQSGVCSTIAWAGPPTDFRYILLSFAAMKSGHRVYFPSPRNSIDVHVSLLNECGCQAFLQPEEMPLPFLDAILQRRPMKVAKLPRLDSLMSSNASANVAFKRYEYSYDFATARYKPCMILHTSGSTGVPKPIAIKHGWYSVIDAFRDLGKLGANQYALAPIGGLKVFMPFPNFHGAGLSFKMGFSVFFDSPMVSPPGAPLTADLAADCLEYAGVQAAFFPPSILREMIRDPKLAKSFEHVEYVASGGAPLGEDVARALEAKTYCINGVGVTEASLIPGEVADKEDLLFLHFGPNLGLRFDLIAEDQYEMVIVRDDKLDLFQGIFVTYPDLSEWRTKDLWSKHPSKPDLWFYQGRTDDVIIFHNGEKFNPLSMEQSIEAHPDVAAALVTGAGRFQASLLLEPRRRIANDAEKERFINEVWPTINSANRQAVAHGRIDRNFVLVASSNKPFLRASKGSLQRKLTVQLYADELDAVYHTNETGESVARSVDSTLSFSTFGQAAASLRQALSELDVAIGTDDDDFFTSGLDSLQTANLARRIRSATGNPHFTSKILYAHPSIRRLAAFIAGVGNNESDTELLSREERMQACLDHTAKNLPINVRRPSAFPSEATVLLTGSTGSLGSYLLDSFLEDPRIKRIICLNRSPNAKARQEELHNERHLNVDLSRVIFLQSDVSKEYMGLSVSEYRHLLESVTHILHNAWPVDFNRSLTSFEPHVQFVRQLIDFSARSAFAARIYFLSTIGVTQRYSQGSTVPEQIIEDLTVSQAGGYPESKHISELLLARAAAMNVQVSICRVGQIAGPVLHGTHGKWPVQEWLPSIIASSIHLGVIPDSLGPADEIDWIPVDVLAKVLRELLMAQDSHIDRAHIHHAVNPKKISWKSLLPSILASIPSGKQLKTTSFVEWVDDLEKSAGPDDDSAVNPAIKLLDYFVRMRGLGRRSAKLPTLDVTATCKQSQTLNECVPVSETWMTLWMKQWDFQ